MPPKKKVGQNGRRSHAAKHAAKRRETQNQGKITLAMECESSLCHTDGSGQNEEPYSVSCDFIKEEPPDVEEPQDRPSTIVYMDNAVKHEDFNDYDSPLPVKRFKTETTEVYGEDVKLPPCARCGGPAFTFVNDLPTCDSCRDVADVCKKKGATSAGCRSMYIPVASNRDSKIAPKTLVQVPRTKDFPKIIVASPKVFKRNDSYQCNLCGAQHSALSGYLQHMRAHKEYAVDTKVYSCEICKVSFSAVKELLHHKKTLHEINFKLHMYECPHCDDKFENFRLLKHHQNTKHIEQLEKQRAAIVNYPPNFRAGKLWQCHWCGKQLTSAKLRRTHEEETHYKADGMLKCEFCPLEFPMSRVQELEFHRQTVHPAGNSRVLDSIRGDYVCQDCGMTYVTSGAYVKHLQLQHREVNDKLCKFCHGEFESIEKLMKHVKERHPSRVCHNPVQSNLFKSV